MLSVFIFKLFFLILIKPWSTLEKYNTIRYVSHKSITKIVKVSTTCYPVNLQLTPCYLRLLDFFCHKEKRLVNVKLVQQDFFISYNVKLCKKRMEISGIEPEASHMRSERSTTELYPLLYQRLCLL